MSFFHWHPWLPSQRLQPCHPLIYCFVSTGIPGSYYSASSRVTHLSFPDTPKHLWSLFSQPSADTRTPVSRSQAVTTPLCCFLYLGEWYITSPKRGCQLPVPASCLSANRLQSSANSTFEISLMLLPVSHLCYYSYYKSVPDTVSRRFLKQCAV